MKCLDVAKIRHDVVEAILYQLELLKNPGKNFEVLKGNYLNVETSDLVLPMRHPHGKFVYYNEISDGLECLLKNGLLNTRIVKSNPPNYVLESVKR